MHKQSDQLLAPKKAILVTGSHRSGSTWVGRILSNAPSVAYIHEPFSVTDPPGPGICNARFRYWFTYINRTNESHYYRPIEQMLALRYNLIAALTAARSRKQLRSSVSDYRRYSMYRRQGFTPLVKDPIAFFSAEWLAARFGMHIVVLIRHPAAFVSSVMKLQWRHPFGDFLHQDLLMSEVLYPFKEQVRAYARHEQEIIDQAILLWRMIHYTVQRYQQAHDDWTFIRHEDLSRDPTQGFHDLFQASGLRFTPRVEAAIAEYSRASNPPDPKAPVGSEQTLRRNSQENIHNWRKRLTPRDIDKIRRGVEDIAGFFYTDTDW